jgi:hypothetical protein
MPQEELPVETHPKIRPLVDPAHTYWSLKDQLRTVITLHNEAFKAEMRFVEAMSNVIKMDYSIMSNVFREFIHNHLAGNDGETTDRDFERITLSELMELYDKEKVKYAEERIS